MSPSPHSSWSSRPSRRRILVALLWVTVLAIGASAAVLFDPLNAGAFQHERAHAAEQRHQSSVGGITAVLEGRPAGDPALQADLAALTRRLEEICGVASVATSLPAGAGRFVDTTDTVALSVEFDGSPAGEAAVDQAADLIRDFDAPHVRVSGER
jgi:RND superfamily putative drug exporter